MSRDRFKVSLIFFILLLMPFKSLAALDCKGEVLKVNQLTVSFRQRESFENLNAQRVSTSVLEQIYDIHRKSRYSFVPLPTTIHIHTAQSAGADNHPQRTALTYSVEAEKLAAEDLTDAITEELSHEMGHILYQNSLSFFGVSTWFFFNSHMEEMFADFMEELIYYNKNRKLREAPAAISDITGRTFTPMHTPPYDQNSEDDETLNKKFGKLDPHIHTNDARLAVGRFIEKRSLEGDTVAEIYTKILTALIQHSNQLIETYGGKMFVRSSLKDLIAHNRQFVDILENESETVPYYLLDRITH